ncbi:MAG TPA: RNA polymerase sigma factor [Candidatus Limnocylindrales bacterium]|nr:RNA polymerase sigma factor [Candidatus Limnocylindrales bacterium]
MEPVGPAVELVDVGRAGRQARDDAIVTSAFAAHHEELYAFLVRATHDPDVAEELLQDAFCRLTREVRAGRTPELVRPWLYRVAANLATSRGRRLRSALRWFARATATADPIGTFARTDDPEARAISHERTRELIAALDGLAVDARLALLLSAEGFSGLEIAAALGRSHAATRTLLSRSRVRVRTRLEALEASR